MCADARWPLRAFCPGLAGPSTRDAPWAGPPRSGRFPAFIRARAERQQGTACRNGEDVHARDRVRGAGISHSPKGFLARTVERVANDPRGPALRSVQWGPRTPPGHRQPDGPWCQPLQRDRPDRGRAPCHRRSRPRRPDARDGHGRGGHSCCPRCWADVDQRWFVPHHHSGHCAVALQAWLRPGAGRAPGRQIPQAALHRVRVDHSACQPLGGWSRERRRHRSHPAHILREIAYG